MDKRKQKKIKRAAAAYRKPSPPCPNCGQPGAHFAPPSFGDGGFFICPNLAGPLPVPEFGDAD